MWLLDYCQEQLHPLWRLLRHHYFLPWKLIPLIVRLWEVVTLPLVVPSSTDILSFRLFFHDGKIETCLKSYNLTTLNTSFTIANFQITDVGNYTCEAENKLGKKRSPYVNNSYQYQWYRCCLTHLNVYFTYEEIV
jgi:hypothetical protein